MTGLIDAIGLARWLGFHAGVRDCLRGVFRVKWADPYDPRRCACAR